MSERNLLQRINAVRKEVSYVKKDKSVGGSYMAVTHDMLTAHTRESLVKHGVISWPNLVASAMILPKEDAKQWRYEATYDFTFANEDKPDEQLRIRIEAHAMDNADKAPGKALSYAKKYALLKLLDIETGEDEEGRVPERFDPGPWLEQIKEAADGDALKKAYAAAFTAAKADKDAQKTIIAAKDARKKELGL